MEVEKEIARRTAKRMLAKWRKDLENLQVQFYYNEKNLIALIKSEEETLAKLEKGRG